MGCGCGEGATEGFELARLKATLELDSCFLRTEHEQEESIPRPLVQTKLCGLEHSSRPGSNRCPYGKCAQASVKVRGRGWL